MKIVCQYCENIQEKNKINSNRVSYKKINNIEYYKVPNSDWKILPLDICNKCGKEIEPVFKLNKISLISNERNDPSHINYWKNGKTNNQIADIISDESINPY
jgi:hypothetical protein